MTSVLKSKERSTRRLLATAVLSLTLAACVPAAVVSVKTNLGFNLHELRNQPVAFWPIPTVRIAPAMTKAMTKEHGSSGRFLDYLGETMSAQLAQESQAHVIGSRELSAALGRTEATRSLLDSNRLLGPDSDNRFANTTQVDLATLGAVPGLSAVRYFVLPRDCEVAFIVTQGPPVFERRGAQVGVGTWVIGGRSAQVQLKIRLVVMDWKDRSIAWDGWIESDPPINFGNTTTALHKAEVALIQKFMAATGFHSHH